MRGYWGKQTPRFHERTNPAPGSEVLLVPSLPVLCVRLVWCRAAGRSQQNVPGREGGTEALLSAGTSAGCDLCAPELCHPCAHTLLLPFILAGAELSVPLLPLKTPVLIFILRVLLGKLFPSQEPWPKGTAARILCPWCFSCHTSPCVCATSLLQEFSPFLKEKPRTPHTACPPISPRVNK